MWVGPGYAWEETLGFHLAGDFRLSFIEISHYYQPGVSMFCIDQVDKVLHVTNSVVGSFLRLRRYVDAYNVYRVVLKAY